MQFKISVLDEPVHKSQATCVAWSNAEEVFSCGDDNHLFRWNVANNEASKITEYPNELLPTDLQWIPRGPAFGKVADVILLTGADGRFHIINRNGRIERSIEGHKGAVLVGRWSHDGAGLLTAGEDGQVKVWSRGGMLRSTVVVSENPVYSAEWAPDSQSILYTQSKVLVIKQLAPNTKPVKWRAHDGLVLCVAWSSAVNLIISGAEDCKYKVWDPQGRLMFSSGSHDYPITSLAWAPQGDLFSIGAFNTLRLCDSTGWSHSLNKMDTGSLYNISWSNDGTQIAAACATGHILFAHLIDRHFQWQNFSARITERKTLVVKDVLAETEEQLDFSERVIKVAIGYGHLVATTPAQCHIYTTTNWNTPTIFDLKDGAVNHLVLAEKYLTIVERANVSVYTYQGRVIASPRWQAMNPENLSRLQISLSSDTLAVCDQTEHKSVYIFELGGNRSMQESTNSMQHHTPITQVALSQAGPSSERQLALVDKNKDLYMASVRGTQKIFSKLGGQVQSLYWNTDYNILAAIQDVRLVVWYTPGAAYFSQQLLRLSSLQYDSAELGRGPKVTGFNGTAVLIRRADGSLLNIPISPYATVLHEYIMLNKWNDILDLCRMVQDTTLWACLAVLATLAKMDALDTAEEAYAAINQPDKVTYIQHIKGLSNKAQQLAAVALLAGSIQEAETILIHNGLVYQAITTNIQMHNWNRALDLAVKHKTHIDTVLFLRQKYLQTINKEENNVKFLKLKDSVTVDENKISEKLRMEGMKN
ncbi:Outer segment 5 [Carabus blaptoides fortunei]